MDGKRVLVVSWSAAEWGAIHPALDRGELPHLQSLVERGSSGPLAALAPLSVPVAATTLATGFHPAKHGVLAELEPRPDGGGVQPAGRRSWRKPAIWENLAAAGFRTAVVNWPATAPADLWQGFVVDDCFAVPEGRSFDAWPMPPHCVAPEALRPIMAQLRVHPSEIGGNELSALVPRFAEIDLKRDRRPARLAASLARAATVHAATTHVAELAEWDFLITRYSLVADVWRDLAVNPAGDDGALYAGIAAGAYRLLDVMLGRLLELAGRDTTVFVVAASGWRTAGLPVDDVADDEGVSAYDKGLLVASGSGIKSDAIFHRANVADIAPTILACFGLSVPSDGVVLDALFAEGAPETKSIEPPPVTRPLPGLDAASHLLALGYRDKLTDVQLKALADADLAALRNLTDSHLARCEWPQAISHLETILQRVPGDYLAHLKLGRVLLNLGDVARARPHADAALLARPELPWGDLLMGSLHAAAGDGAAAEPYLLRARSLGGQTLGVNLRLGWAAVLLGRWSEAEASFRFVIARDETVAEAHTGLGLALQGQDRIDEAEAGLRMAIALVYDSPIAHFHLGQILASRSAYQDAAASLRLALAQNPALSEAKHLLANIEKAAAITAVFAARAKIRDH